MSSEEKSPSRQYPPVYEKIVPALLFVLALVIVGVLLAAVGVALGIIA